MQRKRPAKVLDADERKRNAERAVRVEQYTALFLMRQLQAVEFDSDTQPAIDWMDLRDGEFVALDLQQQKRLPKTIAILHLMLQEKNATDVQMRAALTETEYAEYKDSFSTLLILPEDEWQSRPSEIDYYLQLLKLGDFYNGAADRILNRSAVSKHGTRYDSRGRPTSAVMRDKAEKCYEEALMYLRGECEELGKEGMLQRWFDRPLDFNLNTSTLSADAVGVPRLRGSRSTHCLDKTHTVWGAQKSKHYRQRDAIANSAFALLFEPREPYQPEYKMSELVRQLIAKREERKRLQPETKGEVKTEQPPKGWKKFDDSRDNWLEW